MDPEEAGEWLLLFKLIRENLNSIEGALVIMEKYINKKQKNVTDGEIL